MHVGTHKTGTTTLQHALRSHEDAFAHVGVLVARTGRPFAPDGGRDNANHNIAFDLNADARFAAGAGTLDDLRAELAATPLPMAIVTSEDFAFAFDARERLERLREAVRDAGFDPAIVVYLREQAAYAQSLYAMLAGSAPEYAVTFDEYAEYIFDETKFRYGFRDLPFDYDELLDGFAAVFGRDRIFARAFRTDRGDDYLLRDFVAVIEPGAFDVEAFGSAPRLHEARTFEGVLETLRRAYGAIHGEGLPAREIAARAGFDAAILERPFAAIAPEQTHRFRARSAAANARVRVAYGVEIEQTTPRDPGLSEMQNVLLRVCASMWTQ